MMEKQKREPGETLVSTVLFDQDTKVIHDRVPLEELGPLTEEEYYVRGSTALLDAVGGASRHYDYDRVKAMIRRQQERYGWEFLFLGANIDAAQEAGRFGIRPECAADYHADSRGTQVIYESLAEAVCQVRTCAAPLRADWKKEIDRDFKGRK